MIGIEGNYVDDPSDPGGATKYGISQRAYPTLNIQSLTLDDARNLYKTDYWSKAQCDKLPPALALCLFDSVVNAGPGTASILIKALQLGLGVVQDGVIGPQTQAAIAKMDPATAVSYAQGARILYQTGLGNWSTYKNGWARRLAQIPFQAGQLAAQGGTTA